MTAARAEDGRQRRDDLAALRLDRSAAASIVKRPRRRWPRRLGATLLAAAIGASVWAFARRPIVVQVAQATVATPAESGPVPVLSGSGYIVTGERYVSIGVRVPGRIDRYFVEEGQTVHKGGPLVQIDDRDYRANVARAQASLALGRANLNLAEADLRRGEALRRQGVISAQEFDILRNKFEVGNASVQQLSAELNQAQVNLEYTLLRAPTDGVVLAKLKEVGEIAVPGGFAGSGDLIRIANLSDLRTEVDVNEADLARVRIGQAAEVTPDAYPDAHYAATIVKMYPQVDRQKGTLKVEARIENADGRLLPDMSARVTFFAADPGPGERDRPLVFVPLAALRRDDKGNSFVWTVKGEHVSRTVVESAGTVGERARVAAGLRGGETVVVDHRALREGQRVVAGRPS